MVPGSYRALEDRIKDGGCHAFNGVIRSNGEWRMDESMLVVIGKMLSPNNSLAYIDDTHL